MIKFINKELFNIETKTTEEGCRTFISSSISTMNDKTHKESKRVLTVVDSAEETFEENKSCFKKAKFKNISILSSDEVRNDTDIYLVAIPFNGFIKSIEQSFDYRIYKGFIVHAPKRNISFNGQMYKKIAYMIVVPNARVFAEDHKYHKDQIDLIVESFNLETVEDDKKQTKKLTTTIQFTKDQDAVISCEQIDVEPVDPADFKGKVIFPIYAAKKDNKKKPVRKEEKTERKSKDLDSMIDDFNKKHSDTQKAITKRNMRH